MSKKNTLFNYFGSPTPRKSTGDNSVSPNTSKEFKTPNGTAKTISSSKKSGSDIKHVSKPKTPAKGDYNVYDIVWSKLEGYPWWPSIVCNHPKLLKHIKGSEIHVQFFDDPPTRAWIKKKMIEQYKSSSDKSVPSKDAVKWKKATEEADSARKLSVEEREKLIVAFDSGDNTSEEEATSDDDGVSPLKRAKSDEDSESDNKENTPNPALKRILLDGDDSEDDYKPGNEDGDDSDSVSSGVDSNEESFSAEEPEIDSPVKKKRRMKDDDKRKPKKMKTLNGSPKPSLPSNKEVSLPSISVSQSGDWAHFKYDFLKPENIRDANRKTPKDPEYNPRTLYVPEDFKRNVSPGMKQWWDLKIQNFDCVLFFKVGKFYELYHMDAVIGVNELGLTFMKGDFAHSGFPEIAYSRFASSLVERGYKVARVEQTETPEMMAERVKGVFRATKFDKVVKREVCQITTRGTCTFSVLDGETKEASTHYLLAVTEKKIDSSKSTYGVCFVDTTIGVFHIGEFTDDRYCSHFRTMIAHYPPVQILYNRKTLSENTHQLLNTALASASKDPLSPKTDFWPGDKTLINLAEGKYFPKEDSGKICWPEGLKPFLSETDSLGLYPKDEYSLAISSLGAIVCYLQKCYIDHQLLSMGQFKSYNPTMNSSTPMKIIAEPMAKYMILDGITLKNLDILENSSNPQGSLLYKLDFCNTKFGKRLLRQWICSPLCDPASIKSRQEAISDLRNNTSLIKDVCEKLSRLPDLERLLSSIHAQGTDVKGRDHPDSRAIFYEEQVYSKRKIQNFLATLSGFKVASEIARQFQGESENFSSKLLLQCTCTSDHANGKFPDISEALDYFNTAFDHETATQEGRIVPHHGVDPEYDNVLDELKKLSAELQDYLNEQKKFFGCKVTYIGTEKKRFQLEVPDLAAHKAGNNYELQSQRKGFKRFVTAKTKDMLARQLQAEDNKKTVLQDLSRRIFAQFSTKYDLWNSVVQCISVLDVLISLTLYTEKENTLCIPVFMTTDDKTKPFVKIREGRHPCISSMDGFVSNDTIIGCEDNGCNTATKASMILLTGPNMGGKSTLMRQLGLLTVMAHMGCHIPAEECVLTPVDRIFTRLGANDDIMAGESTFFVELSETSAIFHQATKHSLVLIDELGRGTSTHDGTAIAVAAVKELIKLGCRTLFSTHYHNLVEDFKLLPEVALRHMACMVENEDSDDPSEESVMFLYKLDVGACPKSYGFNAARLGGIPSFITSKAHSKAKLIEEASQMRKLFRSICKATSNDIIDRLTTMSL